MKQIFGRVYSVKLLNLIPCIGIRVNSRKAAVVFNVLLVVVVIAIVTIIVIVR